MTLHTYDTNPQDSAVKVATVKKKPAKKTKAGAKAKTQLTKVVNQKPKTRGPQERNLQWEKFAELYTGKHLGNALQSYLEAYGCDYDTARSEGSRLLINPSIKELIRKGLDAKGFTDENADAQHLFLMNQFEDFPTKARMIEAYNKLKRRTEEQAPVTNVYVVDQAKVQRFRDMRDRIKNKQLSPV